MPLPALTSSAARRSKARRQGRHERHPAHAARFRRRHAAFQGTALQRPAADHLRGHAHGRGTPTTPCRNWRRPPSIAGFCGHSPEEIRQQLIAIVNDGKVKVRYVSNSGEVTDRAPDTKAFPPLMPSPEILQPLERVAAAMWPAPR